MRDSFLSTGVSAPAQFLWSPPATAACPHSTNPAATTAACPHSTNPAASHNSLPTFNEPSHRIHCVVAHVCLSLLLPSPSAGSPFSPLSGRFLWSVIPLHWQIFIGHRPKKYRTSNENIGFIGHVYFNIQRVYQCNAWYLTSWTHKLHFLHGFHIWHWGFAD